MSAPGTSLQAIFIDGETKTGKGAASKAVADALSAANYQVYYDVAGDFYRRYVALVRHYLNLEEQDDLPSGQVLLDAAIAVHKSKQAYESHLDLGDLQRSAISRSVSVMGALKVAQDAGAEWYALSLQRAHEAKADVIVLDGRNPRNRVNDALSAIDFKVQTILDLYMTCTVEEAARRALRGRGNANFTNDQLAVETAHVQERRDRDRQRSENPFVSPETFVSYDPLSMQPGEIITYAWQFKVDTPVAIVIDNTTFMMPDMLQHVSTLALSAISYSV